MGFRCLFPPNRHFIRAPKALLKSRRISSIFIVELQRWLNDRHEKVSSRGSSAQSCLMFNDCYLKTLESFGSMRDGAGGSKGQSQAREPGFLTFPKQPQIFTKWFVGLLPNYLWSVEWHRFLPQIIENFPTISRIIKTNKTVIENRLSWQLKFW